MLFSYNKNKKSFGFSLLELLVTVSIIAILSAIIYPSYQSYLTSTYRGEAKVALLDLATRLEQYYSLNNSYKNASLEKLKMVSSVGKGRYQLEIYDAESQTYLIKAIPEGTQANNDLKCGALSLDEKGVRGVSGNGDVGECW